MYARDIIQSVEHRGGAFRLEDGRLQMMEPVDGLSLDLLEELRRHRSEICFYLGLRRDDSDDETRRWHWATDPRREDLVEDTLAWTWLLLQLYDIDFGVPRGLFGAVHFIRCLGARIQERDGGCLIDPGGCPMSDYHTVRASVLMPSARTLRRLLSEMPTLPVYRPG